MIWVLMWAKFAPIQAFNIANFIQNWVAYIIHSTKIWGANTSKQIWVIICTQFYPTGVVNVTYFIQKWVACVNHSSKIWKKFATQIISKWVLMLLIESIYDELFQSNSTLISR